LNEPSRKPIAFLFPAFPVLHQTFVLWEVLALRERGVPIALFSIKRPGPGTQQPEGEALRREVHYLPPTLSLPVFRDNVTAFRRAPRRYLGVYGRMVSAWWRDRDVGREWKNRRISETAPDRQLTRREYWEGRFNRSPLLYLLKSLWLVPIAVHLGNLLRASGIERIHAHWASYPATVALAAHWMFDIPFSFTAHAYDIYLVPRLLSVKVEEAHFSVTCARVNAAFLRSLVTEEAGRRVIVNYHGVNLDRFRPLERRVSTQMPCVVSCGRLEPYKGHHVLLRACALLPQPVRCVIVGEGPQRERLQRLAAELGIADRVELTGPVPQARLTEIYAQADLFVLASVILERSGKRDVIPNVLAEAMAMQLPVVATDISGIGELVTDGVSGRLVPPNDAHALSRVIDELLADPEQRERLARGGAAKVAAEFDRKENVEALTALFKRGFAAGEGERAELQTARSSAGRSG
jgi:glycosyltransferase involved in cell wall biosynthesis